ncbi:hypothetical protein [Kitasatospora purpeofusca]|uniref:hypothetical protein n=1 Tax=Kitasatospora purpeofusca TaxID=67352 RepID=UPI0038632D84|nr:hypothetical protein OIP63_34660 [Kitasatospora purpeofusca]
MGALDAVAARVAGGAGAEFRPSGSSMVPLIRSRQSVRVVPADPSKLEVGDIVLARVAGVPRPGAAAKSRPADPDGAR